MIVFRSHLSIGIDSEGTIPYYLLLYYRIVMCCKLVKADSHSPCTQCAPIVLNIVALVFIPHVGYPAFSKSTENRGSSVIVMFSNFSNNIMIHNIKYVMLREGISP